MEWCSIVIECMSCEECARLCDEDVESDGNVWCIEIGNVIMWLIVWDNCGNKCWWRRNKNMWNNDKMMNMKYRECVIENVCDVKEVMWRE